MQNRRQVTGLAVNPQTVETGVLYLQNYIRSQDFAVCTHNVAGQYQELPSTLSKYISAAEKYKNPREISFREYSAVKSNEKKINFQYERFWYMLPQFAPRHLPNLCITRVSSTAADCVYVPQLKENPIAVDANFVTLWGDSEETIKICLALLNSTWSRCYLELLCTVMGGGALKIEASHVRQLLFPKLNHRQLQRLSEYVFNQIEEDTNTPSSLATYLHDTINIYGKLDKQNFSTKNWLVLSSASGANPCAAYISLETLDRARLIIDQTLYWYLADSEDEAIYIVGLLNSDALSDAIKDFQPEGGFGKRHIHTLPYKIIPKYDNEDAAHIEVISRTRELTREWATLCRGGEYANLLQPNSSSLSSRRRRQQSAIRSLGTYAGYEAACHAVLG